MVGALTRSADRRGRGGVGPCATTAGIAGVSLLLLTQDLRLSPAASAEPVPMPEPPLPPADLRCVFNEEGSNRVSLRCRSARAETTAWDGGMRGVLWRLILELVRRAS